MTKPARSLRAISIACATVVAAAGCASLARTTGDEVRVLTYNIHAGKDAAGVDNLARVADVIRSSGADVVLLQEVDRNTSRSGGVDQLAELTRRTGFHGAFGKSLAYQGGDYGIAVLSRWPVVADSVVPLPVEPPQERSGGSHEPRVAHVAEIAAPGRRMLVVNTHIDASRDDRWRIQEARTLLSLASSLRMRDTTALLLLGGDLNSEPASAVQVLLSSGPLRDAWRSCGAGDSLTYPADSGVKRIDYVYLTGAARCARAEVLRTLASDHRPVLVRVQPR